MAIMAIMAKMKLDRASKKLEELLNRKGEFDTREAALTQAVGEVTDDEQEAAMEEAVATFNSERAAWADDVKKATEAVDELRKALEEAEKAQEEGTGEVPEAEMRKDVDNMKPLDKMTMETRNAFVQREDVKAYLNEVRSAMREKRALTNVGLTIPEVMLGVLRTNIEGYSKLYSKVATRRVAGTGRMIVMGTAPEAVWTDCCANLNEMALTFNDVEVDCFKVGGYFAVCNANIEDSDIDLANEILSALGQAIGLALDKAILYGRNSDTTAKMPQGIVSRLAQTAKPSGYSATARAWADLHSTNMITVTAANSTGVKLVQALIGAAGKAKSNYSNGALVWCMNDTTYASIMTELVTVNAAGAVVSGMGNTMPVIGGEIVILPFMADNQIVVGHFELYLLAERAGQKFAESEHVRFLSDQTVFKGTARYDGVPVIAEAFAAVGINGTAPSATMTFASDTANGTDGD